MYMCIIHIPTCVQFILLVYQFLGLGPSEQTLVVQLLIPFGSYCPEAACTKEYYKHSINVQTVNQ